MTAILRILAVTSFFCGIRKKERGITIGSIGFKPFVNSYPSLLGCNSIIAKWRAIVNIVRRYNVALQRYFFAMQLLIKV